MPTQEELNALTVEYQIAEDNLARDEARAEQYRKVFAAITEMPREKLKDANITPIIKEALADFQATNERIEQNKIRMASAALTLNEYEKQMAAQQAATQQVRAQQSAGQKRRTVTQPKTTYTNSNNYFWGDGWTNNNWTLTSPDRQTIVYPDWSVQFWNDQFKVQSWWQPVYNDKGQIVWEQKPAVKLTPNVQSLKWVPNDFVYTPWMSLKWVPQRVGYWTLSYPAWFPLRGVNWWTWTLNY